MGLFKKYVDIPLLYRVPEIMEEPEVIVMEKPDGTNFRYGFVEGRFRIGGRNEEFDFLTSAPSACFGAVGWARATNLDKRVEELAESLGVEIIFHDEWYGPGIQNRVIYSREKQQRTFDVRVNEEFVDWDKVVELTQRLGHKNVPLLYRGKPDMEVFDRFRVAPSAIAYENALGTEDNIAEGIVIKPAHMHRNFRDDWIIAKYKGPKFGELKSQTMTTAHVPLAVPQSSTAFIDEFFTEERLGHVLNNLRAMDVDVSSPVAMGQVIRDMYNDVLKESKPEYEQLDDESRRSVDKRHATKTKALLSIWLADQVRFEEV